MSKISKPVQWVAAGALVLLLGVVAAAGLVSADDGMPFAKDDQSFAGLFQRVQLQGWWMGMRLGPIDGGGSDGVKVLDLSDRAAWRAKQAGLMPGDVITGVNGKKVTDLPDLYKQTETLNAAGPISMSVVRLGQPISLVLPAMPPALSQQPAAVPQQQNAAQPFVPGAAPAVAPDPGAGPMFYCPRHGVLWTQAQVHPGYRCPLCNGPLIQQ